MNQISHVIKICNICLEHQAESEIVVEEKNGQILTKKIVLKPNFDKNTIIFYS